MMCLCLLLPIGVGAQGAQHWTLDPYAYQYDMTAYITVAVMGNAVSDLSDYEVAAFCGEECRGVSKIQSVEKDGQTTMYGYLRIRSNHVQGENITFKVYQKSLDVELVTFDNTVIFKSQDVIGLPSSPLIINTQEGKSTITFVSEGVVLQSEELNYDSHIILPAVPEREGFTFKGWSPAVPEKVPATDQTFTAQWERNSYKLTFIVDGKRTETTVAYEAAIAKPADPVKVGYTFTGWDKEVASNMPAGDVTYTAQFIINKYTMTFVLGNGQENVVKTQDYATSLFAPVPTKTGYTFIGWDMDVPKTIPAENKTFTAKWTINQYTMTFVLDNGQSNVVKIQDYATALTAPVPSKTGFTFKGWSPAVPETIPATNKTFTAQWERNSYKLTFIVDGKRTETTVAYEAAITRPADPVKVGYTFTGWDKELASTMPAGDVTYTAQFVINQYTMTFVLDNGQSNVVKTQNYATDLTAPVPTKTGYTFIGWDMDIPATVPAEDLTFTAQWERCYVQGDVNHDGNVDVTDVVIIIDHILLKKPANFDATVADVNHDNEIDVTDVVMVIDKILGKIELSRGATQAEKDLTAYTAFQMDLTIPAGYVLEGVELTEMAKGSHKLAYSKLADGSCRVVVFSMDNEALPGAWDEVIRLNLRGQGDATVNVDRAMFVTVGGERHELLLNGTTAIASMHNSQCTMHNDVYDLQGRRVSSAVANSSLSTLHSSLKKGVYVIDGKKVVK